MKKITLLFLTFLAYNISYAQDTCATSVTAALGINSVTTINGTVDNGCGWATAGTFGEWYTYTATIDGLATVTTDLAQNDGTINSDDTRLSVFAGTCAALTCIGGNDDISDTVFLTTASFVIENGITYYLHWDDRWSDLPFDFEISETVVTCQDDDLPFAENFTDPNTLLVCWQRIDNDNDGQGWSVVDYDLNADDIPDGDPTLASASWNGEPLNPDNWVISQSLDLTSYSTNDDIELTWDARGIDATFADENYTVYVATSDMIVDLTASSTTFNEIVGQNGGAGVFVSRSLDISALAGQPAVYIAFRHHNVSDEFVLNIDNIAVDVTLGLNDFELNTFTNHYNKDAKSLNLESSLMPINNVEIYSMLGQNIITRLIKNNTGTIDVSSLNDGVYLAKINIDGYFKTVKFVKN